MVAKRQFSLGTALLLFAGTAITAGLVRAVVVPPDGQFLALVVGLWCGVFYGSFSRWPGRCGLIGGALGMAYAIFTPGR